MTLTRIRATTTCRDLGIPSRLMCPSCLDNLTVSGKEKQQTKKRRKAKCERPWKPENQKSRYEQKRKVYNETWLCLKAMGYPDPSRVVVESPPKTHPPKKQQIIQNPVPKLEPGTEQIHLKMIVKTEAGLPIKQIGLDASTFSTVVVKTEADAPTKQIGFDKSTFSKC